MVFNLEGYESSSRQERHEFVLVAGDSLEAKKFAKSKLLLGYKKFIKIIFYH